MEINEIEVDLRIDLNKLHEEWLKQPSLFMKYSDLAAQAQRKRDQLRERCDVVKAECDSVIREKPGDYNCPQNKDGSYKPTEAWVTATIQRQQPFQKANEEYHAASYVFNLLRGAVDAMEHRKKALEMEVHLWQSGYWSTPYDSGKQVKDVAGVASDKQREGLSRRKRG